MAQLAIRGHATRGKEVIEIIQMLGGENKAQLKGTDTTLVYYICSEGYIDTWYAVSAKHYKVFTLEEFLEKFPYKVGNKVIFDGHVACVTSMRWDGIEVVYKVKHDDVLWDTIGIHLQPYKEAPIYLNEKANKQFEEIKRILEPVKEIMEERDKAKALDLKGEDYSFRRFGYKIPNGYEFEGITNNEIILKPIKPQYPKTYAECCKVLCCKPIVGFAGLDDDEENLYGNFIALKRCRDTYWKIAGEQIGLSKPWEPDWLNTEQDKFVLYTHDNVICLNRFVLGHNVLAFPTAEMRDAFLENFKELIELCKELL